MVFVLTLLLVLLILQYHVVVSGLATPLVPSSSSSSNSNNNKILLQQPPLPTTSGIDGVGTITTTTYNKKKKDDIAQQCMSYLNHGTDPFHVVQTSIQLLQQVGFIEYDPSCSTTTNTVVSSLQPGGKYYYTRNRSTLVAFAIGGGIATATATATATTSDNLNNNKNTGNWGIKIIGGHTDSPNLRIKPRSIRTTTSETTTTNCIQLGVECYGGGLWHTWFDRDLGMSGRVFVKRNTSTIPSKSDDDGDSKDGTTTTTTTSSSSSSSTTTTSYTIQQELIQIRRPILRISNLAIHLQNEEERKAFKINKEDHLSPILAMAVTNALTYGTITSSISSSSSASSSSSNANDDIHDNENEDGSISDSTPWDRAKVVLSNQQNKDGWREYQEPILLHLLAQELQCDVTDIVDFELHLFDIQSATMGGAFDEFLFSSRLDNLASCYLAVQSLIDYVPTDTFTKTDTDVSMIVLYDHEEVGSTSAVGAASPILQEAVKLISLELLSPTDRSDPIRINQAYNQCIQNSFVISSDQAHAIHPNYSTKHEKNHQPKMNSGMVIKRNSNQRYATTPMTGVIIREISRRAQLSIPIQEFMIRQDCGCGSTIGPIISSVTGIRTIDMGCPQLSMHSIRETMGVYDLIHGLQLFTAYFHFFRQVDNSIEQ